MPQQQAKPARPTHLRSPYHSPLTGLSGCGAGAGKGAGSAWRRAGGVVVGPTLRGGSIGLSGRVVSVVRVVGRITS